MPPRRHGRPRAARRPAAVLALTLADVRGGERFDVQWAQGPGRDRQAVRRARRAAAQPRARDRGVPSWHSTTATQEAAALPRPPAVGGRPAGSPRGPCAGRRHRAVTGRDRRSRPASSSSTGTAASCSRTACGPWSRTPGPRRDVEILLVDNASDGRLGRSVRSRASRAAGHPAVDERRVRGGGQRRRPREHRRRSSSWSTTTRGCEPGFLTAIVAPHARAPAGEDVGRGDRPGACSPGRYRPAPDPVGPGEGLVGHDGRRWVRADGDGPGVHLLNSTGDLMTRSGNGRDRDWLAPADSPPSAPDVFGFNGGCAALRATARWTRSGPSTSALFMYYEDTELSWRLRRARLAHRARARRRHRAPARRVVRDGDGVLPDPQRPQPAGRHRGAGAVAGVPAGRSPGRPGGWRPARTAGDGTRARCRRPGSVRAGARARRGRPTGRRRSPRARSRGGWSSTRGVRWARDR